MIQICEVGASHFGKNERESRIHVEEDNSNPPPYYHGDKCEDASFRGVLQDDKENVDPVECGRGLEGASGGGGGGRRRLMAVGRRVAVGNVRSPLRDITRDVDEDEREGGERRRRRRSVSRDRVVKDRRKKNVFRKKVRGKTPIWMLR